MNPKLPPAEPIVDTMTISVVLIFERDRKKKVKKMSAAMVGPSSITPKERVRYEFIAHRTIDRIIPATTLRTVTPGTGARAGTSVTAAAVAGAAGAAVSTAET